MTIEREDVLATAATWRAAGKGVALATVVATWGSSPRPMGSQLAVDDSGAFIGSVSGGCVEGAVIHEALEVIVGGRSRVLDFGVTNEQAWEVGLACGGKIQVYVERLEECTLLDSLLSARGARRPVALVTTLASGDQALVYGDASGQASPVTDDIAVAARQALAHDRNGIVETPQGNVFIHVFNPSLRMIIVGAVHIAQSLVPMAGIAGYDVTVIDPRRAFATNARFPDVAVVTQWPDKALARLAPDHRTAVVTLTHDPKLDDPALSAALRSSAGYIGSLGSRRTHAGRLKRLARAGFSDEQLARIHGPVGLAIGAKSTAEIAIAIMAQVTQVLRQGPAT